MIDRAQPDNLAVFSFFPVAVPLETCPRRMIMSTYELQPGGAQCYWIDAKLSLAALLARLEMSFVRTRGVPPIVLARAVRPLGRNNAREEPIWAPQFLRFCTHYGCRPVPASRDAVWEGVTKDALLGRLYGNQAELETTLELCSPSPPHVGAGLRPLPNKPFLNQEEVSRRACADGFVLHAGDYYSVPQAHAGRAVWIRHGGAFVEIAAANGDPVATHVAGSGRGDVIMNPVHFTAMPRQTRETRQLQQAFLERFPGQRSFLSLLIAQRRNGACDSLRNILRLADQHRLDSMEAAFQKCIRYNNFSHRFVNGLLGRCSGPRPGNCSSDPAAIQGELF